MVKHIFVIFVTLSSAKGLRDRIKVGSFHVFGIYG